MSGYDDWIGQNIPDEIMEQAAHWMALLDSNQVTEADRGAFAAWLGEDPLHQGAFEELSEVWARLCMLSDVPAMIEHPKIVPFPASAQVDAFEAVLPPKRSEWTTLAASLLVIVGVLLHVSFGSPSDVHTTQVGQIESVVLEDGSRVELNALTAIAVQVDDRRREIRLSDGEAIFHVEKDDRPFVVKTELAVISAVGTRFSVRSDASMVEVSVLNGLVSVAATNPGAALTEYESNLLVRFSDEIALLGAGQRLKLTRESQHYQVVEAAAMDNDLSWRNGEIVFADTPLMTAVSRLRRYQSTNIFIGDPVLNSLRVSGRFPTTDVEPFLAMLKDQYGIAANRDSGNYIVLRPD
jgi:transmembrane sensor